MTTGGQLALVLLWIARLPVLADNAPQQVDEPATGCIWAEIQSIPPNLAPSEQIRARIRPVEGDGSEETVDCALDDRHIDCKFPVGRFDLELQAPGLAPAYFWDVVVTPLESVDLGIVRLELGSLVRGTVRVSGSLGDVVTVKLIPEDVIMLGSQVARNEFRVARTETDRNGSFHFAGVRNGMYSIVASEDGYSSAWKRGLFIEPAAELDIGTLVMRPLSDLDLFVTPPVDFAGRPWRVQLLRVLPLSSYDEIVRHGEVTEGGAWGAEGLERGRYRIRLSTSDGESALAREVSLESNSVVSIEIDQVPIEGRLTLAEEPLSASVSFIWEDGSRFRFRSDESGLFKGLLPSEGNWRIEVAFGRHGVALMLEDEVQVERGLKEIASVTIDLPGGEVKGSVANESGHPAQASVAVFREWRLVAAIDTSPNGRYEIKGLKGGLYSVRAIAREGESDLVATSIGDGATSLDLVVSPRLTIGGRVTDVEGRGIPGALVRYVASTFGVQEVTAGLNGDFEFAVPHQTRRVGFCVLSPGMPLKVFTHTLSPEMKEHYLAIVLNRNGGTLHVGVGPTPPWPLLSSDGTTFFHLPALFLPHGAVAPRELEDGAGGFALRLEPGSYLVCGEPAISPECMSAEVRDGIQTAVDARRLF